MITYEYEPYKPDDDNQFTPERLMSMLSDMIMKYNISLDEALKLLIEKGVPVNIFLKEGGMSDLVSQFLEQINESIREILEKYEIQTARDTLKKGNSDSSGKIEKSLKRFPELSLEIEKAMKEENQDLLRRLLWSLQTNPEFSKSKNPLERYLQNLEDLNRLNKGLNRYNFTGKESLGVVEAIDALNDLNQLTALAKALQEAVESGDLYNLDLENIAKFLGAESYQEFLEKRESIFEKLKELLKNKGHIQENEEGGIELSPSSVRKIGKSALIEIFSNLKSDSSSGHHSVEFGDSENITSVTKKLEFGDNVSNIDFSGSMINSILRGNGPKPSLYDLDVFKARGAAKSSTVILLDMSGSMARSMRFYNAKKVTMALDALIRSEYKDEKLTIIGFGSTAKIVPISKLPLLNPYPVTIYNPYIKLKYDFSRLSKEEIENRVPMYFTNLQKGLSLARSTLSSKQTKNKQIILITDGAPTAHFKGSTLYLNYPPSPADFDEALDEVKRCRGDEVVINTFLLTSEWDFNYFGEESFIKQFAKIANGRIFYPHPNELNQMILYDFISNKKKKIAY